MEGEFAQKKATDSFSSLFFSCLFFPPVCRRRGVAVQAVERNARRFLRILLPFFLFFAGVFLFFFFFFFSSPSPFSFLRRPRLLVKKKHMIVMFRQMKKNHRIRDLLFYPLPFFFFSPLLRASFFFLPPSSPSCSGEGRGAIVTGQLEAQKSKDCHGRFDLSLPPFFPFTAL